MLPQRTAQLGFTLIELMVVVAMVAILAAIAYPSYAQFMQRSRRAEVQALLQDIALKQQQRLLDVRAYADTLAALNLGVPSSVSPHYTIAIALGAGGATSFTLTATPQGGQSSDTCGTLTLAHTGVKTPATNCW
ncbi:MAG: type IV pilin protein [Hydrogenophaga sp.]|uniref:type IV pilin protein n=1 Tax=Hydrogenophaga sp. TaxID=1904254 RepID=UPI0027F52CD3|nr:type IV pilin protein [Hydrogenophaga sp.]